MLRHVRKGHLERQRDLKNGRERNAADKSRVGDARDRVSNTDSRRDSIVGLLCRCEAFFFADVCEVRGRLLLASTGSSEWRS